MPPRIQSIWIGNPDLMSTTWNPSDVNTPVPIMLAMTMKVAVQSPIFAFGGDTPEVYFNSCDILFPARELAAARTWRKEE